VADAVKDTGIGYGQFKDIFDTFNESIRKKSKENNIMVIDLAKKIPQEKDFMYDIVHHTDNGSIKSAEIISEQLAPLVQQIPSRQKH
jgi:hypothetical protein